MRSDSGQTAFAGTSVLRRGRAFFNVGVDRSIETALGAIRGGYAE